MTVVCICWLLSCIRGLNRQTILRLQWLCRVESTRTTARCVAWKNWDKSRKTSAGDTAEFRSGLLLSVKLECQYWSRIAQPCYPCSAVLTWFDVTFCCGCELPILTSGRTQRANLPAAQWDSADKHTVHSLRVREIQVQFRKRPATWTWGVLFIYLFWRYEPYIKSLDYK